MENVMTKCLECGKPAEQDYCSVSCQRSAAFYKGIQCGEEGCQECSSSDDVLMAAASPAATPDQDERHKQLHLPIPKDEEKAGIIEQAEKAISAAIIQLLTRQPFFGQLLCSLRQVPTWDMPTMGVDGINLFYNPSFVNVLAKPERRGVLCHEVMHLAYRHIQWKRQRNAKLWNCVSDYAV